MKSSAYIEDLESKVKKLNTEKTEQYRQIKVLQEKLDSYADGSWVPRSDLNEVQLQLKNEQTRHITDLDELEKLKNDLLSADQTIDLLEKTIKRKDEEFKNYIENYDKKDKTIKKLQKQISDYQAAQAKYTADQINNISEIQEYKQTIERLTAHISNVDHALEEMIEHNKILEEAIKEREEIIGTLSMANEDLKERIKISEAENRQLTLSTFSNPNSEASNKDSENLVTIQKQLIDTKNMITQLTAQLAEAQKDAARTQHLQVSLDQRNREFRALQAVADQRELELMSDRNTIQTIGNQLEDYRSQLEHVTSSANEQFKALTAQTEFYKQKAIDIAAEKERLLKQLDIEKSAHNRAKGELAKYVSKEYGLFEAVEEVRALKTMISQRQAVIADLITQNSVFERVIDELSRHVPSDFDTEKMAREKVEEVLRGEKKATEDGAVKLMKKALALGPKDTEKSIDVVIEPESAVAPPRDLIVRPFSTRSSLKGSPQGKKENAGEKDTGITFSRGMKERQPGLFKPEKKDKIVRLSNEERPALIDFGVQFDPVETMEVFDSGLESARQLDSVNDLKANLRSISRERHDLVRRLKVYKAELENTQKECEKLKLENEDQRQIITNLARAQGRQPIMVPSQQYYQQRPPAVLQTPILQPRTIDTPSSSESIPNDDSNSILMGTPVRPSVPPLILSPQPSRITNEINSGADSANSLGSTASLKGEQGFSESENNVESAGEESPQIHTPRKHQPSVKQPIQAPQYQAPIYQGMWLQQNEAIPMIPPPQVMMVLVQAFGIASIPPRKPLAKDKCVMSKDTPKVSIDPTPLDIAFGFEDVPQPTNKTVTQLFIQEKCNLAVITTKEHYAVLNAQRKQYRDNYENVLRKSSLRKHRIKDLNEKLSRATDIQDKLSNTINDLNAELARQRTDFQESLLQMRTETDRYVELERQEMKRVIEMSSKAREEPDEERSRELQEVSRLLTNLKNEKQQLEVNLDEARDTARFVQRRNNELVERIRSLEEEKEQMKSQAESSRQMDFQRYANKLKTRLKDMETKYGKLEKDYEELERKKVRTSDVFGVPLVDEPQRLPPEATPKVPVAEYAKIRKLQVQLEEQKTRNGEMKAHLQKAIDSTKRLQKLLQNKEATITGMAQERANLKASITQLKNENANLKELAHL